ncbi:MAG: PspC domain-containing protein [Chitinophagaceae bacterium]
MKKIININLSGRVIPIEDSAYEKLQSYIESLRRYFAKEEDREEIINDIESRIAELMNEKIRKGAASVTDDDINEIIASMGRPEDFEAAENDTTSSFASSSSSSSQKTSDSSHAGSNTYSKKRLYRDMSDKMVGGVCAGIANFINIDPAIVRLLFAIITFGGFGFGIPLYILLWIILPAREMENFEGKRLYRNPEEKVFGGVASGLAAYFGKESWFIRLVFVAPLLLNILFGILSWPFFHEGSFVPNIVFGSLSSTFIIAYIILWIVLPEAKSQYQQMEMRGERVDVNSIRQNVKFGADEMKNRVKEWSEEVKESADRFAQKAKDFSNTRGKSFAAEAGYAARRAGHGVGHMIGVIFKAFFLFIAGAIAFGLFVGLMALIFGGVDFWPLKNFILDGVWENIFAWGTLILFLGVPLIGFIVWLLRRIMRIKSSRGYIGWTFGGLWTLGWISVSLLAASLTHDFRMSNDRRPGVDVPIVQPVNGKMIVKVSEPEIEYSGNIPWFNVDGRGADVTNDTFKLSNVKVQVQLSDDSSYHVEIKKYSRGRTVAEAQMRGEKTAFNYSYADSTLDIGSGIAIGKDNKFRLQQAIVIIRVPAGKKIRFDETLDKLHSVNVRIKYRRHERWDRDWEINNDEYFDWETNRDYTMKADGSLVDETDPESHKTYKNEYRYRNDNNNNKVDSTIPDDIQRQIEEQKRLKEEDIRNRDNRIKELMNQKKEQTGPAAFKINTKSSDHELAIAPSPAFSLATTLF